MSRDPWRALGLSPGASADDIKRAWRRVARKLHPDLNPGDADAAARFAMAREAYEALREGGAAASAPSAEGPDEDWLDACAWMAEVRMEGLRREALPRLLRRHGVGPAWVWALAEATRGGDPVAAVQGLPEPRGWERLRLRWHLRGLELLIDERSWSRGSPLSLDLRQGRARLILAPRSLWAQGIRDEDQVRAAVQRAVDLGVTGALGLLLELPRVPASLEEAAAMHPRWWWQRHAWSLVWLAVLLLIVAMTAGVLAER